MRNLLYLFNNGYKAFPHIGRGGLGYKPPIKIIGDGLHLIFSDDKDTEPNSIFDDKDYSDSNMYVHNPPDHMRDKFIKAGYILDDDAETKEEDEVLQEEKTDEPHEQRPGFITLEQAKRKEGIISLKDDIEKFDSEENTKKIKEMLKKLEDIVDVDEEEEEEEEILSPEEKEQLLKDTDYASMNTLMINKRLDNRGIAFEHFTEKSDNSQKLLKSITNTDENFKGIESNLNFYMNRDITKPLLAYNGKPLHEYALYDMYNNDSIVELKWYESSNICRVQEGKFVGNYFQTPYYAETYEGSGVLSLYNVWSNNLNKYIYPTHNKNLFLYTRLNDGMYYLDMSGLVNGEKPVLDVMEPKRGHKQKTHDGRQLYEIDEISLSKTFERVVETDRYGKKNIWYNIKKSQLKKYT